MATTATELRTEVVRFARALEPELLSGEQAAVVVAELAAVEKAAATARMFAAVRVAKTDAWRGQGHASAAAWLAAQAGITVGRAAAQLRTARQAEDLPATKDAMQRGDLSPDQADAVTGAAAADPDAEDDLLRSASEDTAAELRRKADAARAAATDAAERERRVHRERSVRYRNDAEGAFCLSLRGPGVDGAAIVAMLRPFEEAAFAAARTAERNGAERSTHDNRTYDAFLALLRSHTPSNDDAEAGTGLEPRGGNNTKVIVRIDHSALRRGHTIAGETCDLAGVGPLSVAAVAQLLRDGDPFIAAVVHDGTDVRSVVHLGRGLSAHQRTAIEALGLRCTNIACNRTIALQIDHRHPWATDERTVLDNQDPLCPDCHRRKTHHHWHLEPGTGPRRFLPPQPERAVPTDRAGPPPDRAGPPGPPAARAPAARPTQVSQATLC